MPTTSAQGQNGEEIAFVYLASRGYKIIARNFRTRFGEIDIVAIEDKTLVFVEVKARKSQKFGLPEEAIDKRKLEHIIKAGQYFKLKNPQTPDLQRIDLVAIDLSPAGKVGKVRLIKNITLD